jgi:hypothetical protein
MSEERVYIGPSPELLRSIVEQSGVNWKLAMGELIDNAFDAGATHVELVFEGSGKNAKFTACDNGAGCPDLTTILSLGRHTKTSSTKLGRFGVGAKDAMLWIGRTESNVSIASTHGGEHNRKTRTARVDWTELMRSGQWDIPREDFTERAAEPGEQGTVICVRSSHMRKAPHGQDWANLVDEIGYIYAPAIKAGRQITLKPPGHKGVPQPVTRYQLPPLEPGHIDTEIEVAGRRARVYVGIVKRGEPNRRAGITYTYNFRVIVPASAYGCGEYSFSRIAGIVDLGEGWSLSKNKDRIAANEEELYEAVFRACEPLLRRAEVAGQQLESAAFEQSVNAALNEALRGGGTGSPDAKAKRGKGDEQGAKNPTGTGRKHKRAENEQDGKTFSRKYAGPFRIEFDDSVEGKFGTFAPPNRVILYSRHPFIRDARASRNASTIVMAACSILASGSLTGEQLPLPKIRGTREGNARENFESALGNILRDVRLDGRALSVVPATETAA